MIDLHVHSTFSDGSFTPEQLIHEAEVARLSAVALTDHDSIKGLERFLAAGAKGPVRAVPGVEISADFRQGTMHLLGYFINPHDVILCGLLDKINSSRVARNREILKNINQMGLALTMEEVAAYAGEDNIGRLHFSQALVARGYVKSRDEAFRRYLAKGKPGYADRARLTPARGIAMIRAAGGIAVLAHPFTLDLGKQALIKLVAELTTARLQGIEVYYPQQTPRQMKQFLALAQEFKLLVTGGTDFHGAPMPEVKMGRGFGNMNLSDSLLEQLDDLKKRMDAGAPP